MTNQIPFWLLTVCSALAAALLLPRQTPFPYHYQTGQVWSYQALKAPFDFEVLYPENQVQADVRRVHAEHGPYFLLHTEVTRQQKKQFVQLLNEQARISRHDTQFDDLNKNLAAYQQFGQQLLDHIFAKGLADPTEEVLKENPGFVYVVAGKEERHIPISEVWTVTTALRFLTDTLPYSTLREPEILLPLLEKSLAINLLYSDSLTLVSKRQKLAAVRSTGASVQKGETVVQRGEIVSSEIAQRLDSLARRYDAPCGPEVLLGYGVLALLAFAVFFRFASAQQPGLQQPNKRFLLLPILILSCMAIISAGHWLGAAIPLLLPIYIIPYGLTRTHSQSIGVAVWMVIVFLMGIALDWSAGWVAIQSAGLCGWMLLSKKTNSWKQRSVAAFGASAFQIAAWMGAGLAGKTSDALWTSDVAVFLLVSAGLSLAVFPIEHLWHKQFSQRPELPDESPLR